MKVISSSKFWIILGVIFVLFGFLLAHLCNAELFDCRPFEHESDFVFHKAGPLFVLLGIALAVMNKFKNLPPKT